MSERSFTDLVASITSFLAGSIAIVGLGSCAPEGTAEVVGEPAAAPGLATDQAAGGDAGVPDGAADAGAAPGATPGWSAMAQESIAASEYAPVADGDGGEHFQASNRKQDLRLHFGNGVAVTKRNGEGEVVFTLRAWGREDAMEQAETVAPEEGPCLTGGAVDAFGECLHRVDYARPGLTEWWENRPEGLEHGFTVTAAPEGEGALVFEVGVLGGTVEVDGDEAMIRRTSGDPLWYAGLVVTDSTGRELASWLEEMDGGVRIVVEDGGAIGDLTVDPVITWASWTAESDQASALFGNAVASAGDINGDGYGDVIVGAYLYDNGQTDEGRTYVYLGSSSGLATAAAWTVEGDQNSAFFGRSVASAGDVNGDGYGDVMVGAQGYDNGETDEGRAFVFLGAATGLAASAAWTAESNQASAYFGYSVGSAGDVNGDGYGDVVIGAGWYDNGSTDEGRAYVYLGSSSGLLTSSAWTAEPDQASAYFGGSVSSAGDVNGDGYADVMVGAYRYDNGQSDEGRVYVYLGSSSGLATSALWTAESDQSSWSFGISVGPAGDVNGDGYGDVLVGSSIQDGRAFLYLGSASGLNASAAWTAMSDRYNSSFGTTVSAAGDVNGDGYGDVIVGARLWGSTETDEGRSYVYLGSSAGLATSASWTVESNQSSAHFGVSVAAAGDVNGDGYADVLVGADGYDNGEAEEGRAYVYLGSASGLATSSGWTAESDQASGSFGYSVSSAGDVNGDGYGDVVLGANAYDNGSTDEGRAYVYLGSASGVATTASWTAESDQASAYFGQSVASAGDVNGDGYGDLVVGSFNYTNGQADEGRAYAYLGAASGLAPAPAWTAESDQAQAQFGLTVASAGDVNGDGYGDVVVGAYAYDNDQTNEGRAYVYLGSAAGLSATAAWTAESDWVSAYFGYSVSSAGDVNGDGYGDVLVGAHEYDNGETNEGRAYVYLGSSTGLATVAGWVAEPDWSYAWFGYSVSTAGDVNGDGYGDVVVGARGYENGQANEGRTYVYLGSGSGLATTPAWTVESNQTAAYLGESVAAAGDVNGDGYGDVLIGAFTYDNGHTDEGMAFVYLGASSGTASSAAWSADGGQASAQMGSSVAAAGDINGDGYGDIIVGAYGYDNGSADEGAAFVYYGNGGDNTGPGLALTPQARQSSTTIPISPGLSSASDTFDATLHTARSPFGLGKIKVQVEAKPLGTAFDGTNLQTQSTYTSSGLTGAAITQAVTGLTGSTGYHWRARVLVSPAEGRPQGWGPWKYGGLSGNAVGGHVFTAGTTFYVDADGDGYGSSTTTVISRDATLSGYVTNATDCDDASAAIHPGATEVCDASDTDEDCDSLADDADSSVSASGKTSYYADADGDSYGLGSALAACDQPIRYAPNADDCNDASAAINPAATEVCDASNTDEDCDGLADNNDTSASASGKSTFYIDSDGDSYGSTTSGSYCDQPSGYASVNTDCNDTSSSINPAATEVCDASNTDEDCDGLADNNDSSASSSGKTSYYADSDSDGYGSSTATAYCDQPSGYATVGTDCNDAVSAINPAATEICDASNTDEDCDGLADNNDSSASASGKSTFYVDSDGDGYGTTTSAGYCDQPTGYATSSTDCNDASAVINPAAAEICDASSTDEDCDGLADDADSSTAASGKTTRYADADGDGYGSTTAAAVAFCHVPSTGYASANTDCDDASAAINPAATEICDTSNTDEDCDGLADDADPSAASFGKTPYYVDGDSDGYGSSASTLYCDAPSGAVSTGTDCNDANAAVHPGATEVCDASNTDEDCDGLADNDDTSASSSGKSTFYVDSDGDGFGTTTSGSYCDQPAGYATANTDCNDGAAAINPAATEICDASSTDEDCDGLADDSDPSTAASGKTIRYVDSDADGYGSTASVSFCHVPSFGYAAANTDCNDAVATINPGATEVCDASNTDEDCDGLADNNDSSASSSGKTAYYTDSDGDGYGAGTSALYCDAPSGSVSIGTDCNDANAAIHPGATEICDASNTDEDCDGLADDDDSSASAATRTRFYVDADGDGYGSTVSADYCDEPFGYATVSADCDDAVATTNPGATDIVGDGADNDCDGTETCYVDDDDDGYRPDETSTVASSDGDCGDLGEALGADPTGDCDDADAAFHPGAIEDDCTDPSDYNCDDSTGVADADADGFAACEDCDDLDASINPDATEIASDGIDQDCDGTEVCAVDADSDGYRPDSTSTVASADPDCADAGEALSSASVGDCDDADAATNPAAVDYTGDGIDSDCDGTEVCYVDADSDGYRPDATSVVVSSDDDCADPGEALATAPIDDCDDTNSAAYPGATDSDGDGTDSDCDGAELCFVDADDDGYRPDATSTVESLDGDCDDPGEALASAGTGDCDDGDPAFHPDAIEDDCTDPNDYNCDDSWGYADADADGHAACADCNDTDATVNADAPEIPGDGIDSDCDGTEVCYADTDDDGYTDDDPATVASIDTDCADPGEALSSDPAGDCDDGSTAYHPGAPEGDCSDPHDYNCDGLSGDTDSDADGFAACEDCDDADATINPDASEICDEVDNDCDGTTDQNAVDAPTWYADADSDGYTDPDAEITDCTAPDGYAEATDDDCNDADAGSYPGAEDMPGDGIDQDCDGVDAVIPDTGDSGDVVDTGSEDTGAKKDKGCGCATGGSDAAGWIVGLLGIGLVRRHRATGAGRRGSWRIKV